MSNVDMQEITTAELKQLVDSGEDYILLDCRGADYYNWSHIPGARNLRWKYIEDKAKEVLPDKDARIITFCDGFACNASVRCYKKLVEAGYTNVVEYSGGVADWAAHGHTLATNDDLRIASNVYRFPNQTFYGDQVGSYLIEEEDFVFLIDGPMQLTEEHEDFILHMNKPIKVFMSHGPTAGETTRLQERYGAEVYLHAADKSSEWLTIKPDVLFNEEFDFSDNLHVVHTPGHSPGSSCVYDSRNKIMFTGDHVEGTSDEGASSVGIHDFMDPSDSFRGDVQMRRESAKKLLSYDFDMICPFHYDMIRKNAHAILEKFINKHS